jgi:hypothetical protein
MRKKILIALMLAAALTFAGGVAAQADAVLTLGANPAVLTYPHSAVLTVGFPTSDPATATILKMPAGASEWTTMTLVATTATPTVRVRPPVTTAYKAWIDGVESVPVTVTVKASLTKPQLPGSIRRNRTVTVKGTMAPAGEVDASVTVSVYKLVTVYTRVGKGHLKKATAWRLYFTKVVPLKARNSIISGWTFRWMPTELGQYKIVVSHEDLGHALSVSRAAYTRVRR